MGRLRSQYFDRFDISVRYGTHSQIFHGLSRLHKLPIQVLATNNAIWRIWNIMLASLGAIKVTIGNRIPSAFVITYLRRIGQNGFSYIILSCSCVRCRSDIKLNTGQQIFNQPRKNFRKAECDNAKI